jgi:hypothetical protein
MTTLIIHPDIEIQRKKALGLISKYLNLKEIPEKISKIKHPDLHYINGLRLSSIGIDDVKDMVSSLQYQPYDAPKQIGLIFYCDTITIEAQNSLLKSLEEPSEQTEFILTVSHEKKILPTILSRSHKIFVDEILNIDSNGQSEISNFSKLNVVDQFLKIEDLTDLEKKKPGTIQDFLNKMSQAYRKELLDSMYKPSKSKTSTSRDIKEIKMITEDLKEISRAIHYMSKNTNKKLTLENLILHLQHRII